MFICTLGRRTLQCTRAINMYVRAYLFSSLSFSLASVLLRRFFLSSLLSRRARECGALWHTPSWKSRPLLTHTQVRSLRREMKAITRWLTTSDGNYSDTLTDAYDRLEIYQKDRSWCLVHQIHSKNTRADLKKKKKKKESDLEISNRYFLRYFARYWSRPKDILFLIFLVRKHKYFNVIYLAYFIFVLFIIMS